MYACPVLRKIVQFPWNEIRVVDTIPVRPCTRKELRCESMTLP